MLKEKKAHIRLNVRRSETSRLKDLKLPNVNEENGTHGSSLREMPGGRGQTVSPRLVSVPHAMFTVLKT